VELRAETTFSFFTVSVPGYGKNVCNVVAF
jgi:hypothetical protein